MKRLLLVLLLLLGVLPGAAWAQQQATLSGILSMEGETPEGTRVGVFTVNRDNVWQREVASSAPVAGTFSVTLGALEPSELSPFRSGAVLFPGLTNEYTVSPEGVQFARGLIGMYVDGNANQQFDGISQENVFLGVASLEEPVGFFSLLYVDQPATIQGRGGVTLQLVPGWNIITVSYPQGEEAEYGVTASTDRALLSVYLP
jgi:hypothetical protein